MKKLIYTTLLLLLVIGCSEKSEDKTVINTPGEVSFNIDSTLLGKSIINTAIGVKYAPPLNWNALPKSVMDKIKNLNAPSVFDSAGMKVIPLEMYADSGAQSVLSISSISFAKNAESFAVQAGDYEKVLRKEFNKEELKSGEYTKNGIDIKQFLIQRGERITFKLLFRNTSGSVIQFDYVTSKKNYLTEIKAIESSIGSIQITK